MKRKLKQGSTSVIVPLRIDDTSSSTGAGLTGLTYASSGLVARYKRANQSAWTAISLVAGTLGTWVDGGFVEAGRGVYELSLPDAALSAGTWVIVQFYGANSMADVNLEIELDQINYQDPVRAGLTALPNASAETVGGLITRGTGAGQLAVASGRVPADVEAISGDTVAADNLEAAADGTGYNLGGGQVVVASVAGNVGGNVSGSVGSVAPGGITAASVASDAFNADALAADAAQEIADSLLDRASAIDGYTPRQILRLVSAALAGKISGAGTTTLTIRDVADTRDRIVATVDADGNRAALTLDAT